MGAAKDLSNEFSRQKAAHRSRPHRGSRLSGHGVQEEDVAVGAADSHVVVVEARAEDLS